MSGKRRKWLSISNLILPEAAPEFQPLNRQVMLGSQVLLALQQITDLNERGLSPVDFYQAVVDLLSTTTGFPMVALEIYDAVQAKLKLQAITGQTPVATGDSPDTESPLTRAVFDSKQALVRTAEQSDRQEPDQAMPDFLTQAWQAPQSLQTLISLPMVVHQRGVGVLSFAHPDQIEDAEQLCYWANSLASYVAALGENQTLVTKQQFTEHRLALLGESLQGFTYDWDLASGNVERNPSMGKVFDLNETRNEHTFDSWLQQIHPVDRSEVTSFFEGIWNYQGEFNLDYRICDAQGQAVPVNDRGQIFRNEEGRPIRIIGRVVGTPSILEDGMAQPVALTKSSQEVLDNLKTVVFNTNLEGKWVYLNPAWEALTGFTIEESLDRPLAELVAPEDQQSLLDAFQGLLDGQTDSYRQELRYNTKSGDIIWFAMQIQATLSNEGELMGTSGVLHDISEYKQVEAQLLQNALYDGLTGLPNRVLFMERLRHAYRGYRRNHGTVFGVMFLDLDGFKDINDTYGHLVGDQLLVAVAEKLQLCLRPGDTVSRLGGDEFTILLPQLTHREDISVIGDRILNTFKRPFKIEEHEVQASATIGIAVCAHPYEQPEDLLRNADIALYQAKASGKNQYSLFTPTLHSPTFGVLQEETELRRALEEKEFRLHYQPIFDLPSETMVGVEALLRWEHPQRGLLEPAEFMAKAQGTGLITAMGWQYLREACQQVAQWQQERNESSKLFLSFNLAFQQLIAPDCQDRIAGILTESKLAPAQLHLDIAEESLLTLSENLVATLNGLRQLGVQLCLDHAGSPDGLPTQTELQALPLNSLKIDRAFVGAMDEDNHLEIIRAIIALGRKLNLMVIAVGIEMPPQLAQLRAYGCDSGQGYLFSHALSGDALVEEWDQFCQERSDMSSSLVAPSIVIRTENQQSQLSLFGRPAWTIGRSTESAIVLPDRWVSRNHAELQFMSTGEVYFVDLGSGNGSLINDERVKMPVLLHHGDHLTLGQTDLEFILPHRGGGNSADIESEAPPKTVLMMQSSKLQGEIWREALTSQGISLIWLQPTIDLVQLLDQRSKSDQPLPDLLLLDMTVIKPNPYSFCRWSNQVYPNLKIMLTSGSRPHVPPSERQWAINQGAKDLLSAFPEQNIFANMVEVATKVRIVLAALDLEPTEQNSLSEVLMSIKTTINRETLH
jgi:diguanylate cyclase (GGDEF)-like protein/PAS domain S-box-containing protein